jgi:hypothetical protein
MNAKTFLSLVCILVFASTLKAQTIPRPDPKDPKFKSYGDYIEALVDWKVQQKQAPAARIPSPTCATLAACRKQLREERESKERIIDVKDVTLASLVDMTAQRDNLLKSNKELEAKNAEAVKKYDELKAAAISVYNYAVSLDVAYKTAVEANTNLTDKYNALLQQANAAIQTANARLAKQQRINNALAMYGMMPKYNPPQTLNVNVTDCSKTPALCVH